MPTYLFQHPKTKEVKEIVQRMNEEHVFVDSKGVAWQRIFSIPQMQIDADINPYDNADFVNKTKKKRYSLGDLWDKSAELSEKREKREGKDPIKEKASLDYTKKTGKTHPHALSQKDFVV